MNFLGRVLRRLTLHAMDRKFGEIRRTVGVNTILVSRNRYDRLSSLADAAVKVFSQWGEDGIIDYLLFSLGIERPVFIEIGTGDYSESNTRFLADTRSCRGLIIDYADDYADRVGRVFDLWRTDVTPVSAFVTRETIRAVLAKAEFSGSVDLVSIDIDGVDYWVLNEMDLSQVKLIIVEYNSLFGSKRRISIDYAADFQRKLHHTSWLVYGASLRAFVDLLEVRGFRFVGCNDACTNAFFCRLDLIDKLTVPLPSTGDLSPFTQCRVRELRAADGSWHGIGSKHTRNYVTNALARDIESGELVKVSELFENNS